ncbi:MAG: metal-dependent hydrolase [Spirochaetes bacterium]|nr:metal-dependent hydrolase [Spirochaetota bacterium]
MSTENLIKMNMPQVRRPNFGLENNFSKYYADGNPLLSHILNSLHIVFPEGEKLFIRSVKYFQDQIEDPQLKARVKGFIGQETQHMAQHEKIWDTLESQGVTAHEFDKWYSKNAYETVEGTIRNVFGEEIYKRLALAVTCGLEHYTATLAEVAIDPEINALQGFDEKMKALLMWHAAEEIEHKAVAFDVMQAVDGSPVTKSAGMLLATWALLYYGAIGSVKFLLEDKEVKLADLPQIFAQKAPLLAKAVGTMLPKLLQYFRPDFHPNQMNNDHLATEYFDANQKYFQKAG